MSLPVVSPSARFVSRSLFYAWGSFLSSDTCKPIRTGPTSSLIHKLIRSVCPTYTRDTRGFNLSPFHWCVFSVFLWLHVRLRCWILELLEDLTSILLMPTLRWEVFSLLLYTVLPPLAIMLHEFKNKKMHTPAWEFSLSSSQTVMCKCYVISL